MALTLEEKCIELWRSQPRGMWVICSYEAAGPTDIRVITVGGKYVPSVAHAIETNTRRPVFPVLQDIIDGVHPEVEPLIHAAHAAEDFQLEQSDGGAEYKRFRGGRCVFRVYEPDGVDEEALQTALQHPNPLLPYSANHPPVRYRDVARIEWVE